MRASLASHAPQILPIDLHDPLLALYLPLWYPAKDIGVPPGSNVYSYNDNRTLWVPSGTTWSTQGRYFDGVNDNLIYPGDSIGTGDITALAWIYPTGASEGNSGRIIDNGQFRWTYLNGTTRMAVSSDNGGTTKYGTNGTVPLNTWAFVGVTRDNTGNPTQLYVNGETDGVGTDSGAPAGGVATIIGNNLATTNTFLGYIGDVIVFDKLLTNPEIRDIYDATKWRYK